MIKAIQTYMATHSWKTTSAGLALILGGLVRLSFMIKAGEVTEEGVMTVITTLLTGAGFFFSRDDNKTSEAIQAGKDGERVPVSKTISMLMIGLSVPLLAGCAGWRPDGQVAGVVPVSAFEVPLNAAGNAVGISGAGTSLVNFDKSAVAKLNAAAKAFPLEGVVTNYYDSKDSEIFPPFRKEETPTYGKRVTNLSADSAKAQTILIDEATVQKAIQLILQTQGAPVVTVPVETTPASTNAAENLP